MAKRTKDIEAVMDTKSKRLSKKLTSFTRRWYGKRCAEYEPECACCKAWHIVDEFVKHNTY